MATNIGGSGGAAIEELLNRVKSGAMSKELAASAFTKPNATEITPTVEYKSPTVNNYKSSTTPSALLNQQIENLQNDQNKLSTFLSNNGATGSSNYEQLMSLQSQRPTLNTQGYAASLENQYGVSDLLNKLKEQNVKVATLQGDIQKLETQELTEIDRAEGEIVSRGAREAEKEVITRKYNIQKAYKNAELYAEAAVAQAYSGNLTEARNMIKDAVQYYTYDKQVEIDRFDKLFDTASEWMQSLTEKEQNILTAKRDELVREEENVRADKTNIGNLMIKYAGAGIRLTDSLEEATAKAAEYEKTHPEIAETVGDAESGYTLYDKYGNVIGTRSGSGTGVGGGVADNFTDMMTEALNSGATPEQAAFAAIAYAEANGIQMKTSDLNELKKKAQELKKKMDEVNNFSPAVGYGDKPAKPKDQSAYSAGQKVKSFFGGVGNFLTSPWTETVQPTASSFFSGLFGK
mgnify:CR=1 FL=1